MTLTKGQAWEFGRFLKERRIEKGWLSMAVAADKTDVCVSSLRRLEAGRIVQVRPKTIRKLAAAYGIPVEQTLQNILLNSPADQRPPDANFVTFAEFSTLQGRLDTLENSIKAIGTRGAKEASK